MPVILCSELADMHYPRDGMPDRARPSVGSSGEPPWLSGRLGLLVSNPGWGGLLGSVERCFELCGWDVVAVAVEVARR